jgi:putative DNA primase/helicase
MESGFTEVLATGDDAAIVDYLARMAPFECDRCTKQAASALKVQARTVEKQVRRRRAELKEEAEKDATTEEVEPWHEPIDGNALAMTLATTFTNYVILPPHAATALALWTVFSHAHGLYEIAPNLAVQSPEIECGKSTLLDVLQELVPKARASSSMTPAAMFRSIAAYKPTVIVDEAESFQSLDPEKIAVFNSMHRRSSAYVDRCVGDDNVPQRFSTWAPLIIACVGELPRTMQSRSIVIGLQRKLPGEQIKRLRLDKPGELGVLKRKAARWVLDHGARLEAADPEIPAELANRTADKWRPLIGIADTIGGLWGMAARHAAVYLSGTVQAQALQSDANRLLQDCRRIFAEQATDIGLEPSELAVALLNLSGSDWSTANHGRPITDKYMAKCLKEYGIVSVKAGGVRRYYRVNFESAWKRYRDALDA